MEAGKRLSGRTVLVTGGSSGIGAGIAAGMAAEGARLVVAGRDIDRARMISAAITANGGEAIAVRMDVTIRDEVAEGIAAAVNSFGRLDAYFNNAGINSPKPFLEVDQDNWDSIQSVNLWGVMVGMQEAAKQFIAQGDGGKIVNTSSAVGRSGFADIAPYCASKSGVIALTQSGARALAEHSITVNGFAPGVVETPLWVGHDRATEAMGRPELHFDVLSKNNILGRSSRPADIAPTAIFLASSDSDYITGQIIPVDGGMELV